MEILAQTDIDLSAAHRTLKRYFGYEKFRELQGNIIHDLLKGRDLLVLMPTGGGKSLCYQVPALISQGVTIVVSPLIALMEDQVNALLLQGVRAAYYNSSLDAETSRQVLAKLHKQQLDLLYIAPERLLMESFLERLQECQLAFFAIDEAHCISQWGHDFRPEYAALGKLKSHFPEVPMIALTATADKQTRADIVAKLAYVPKTYLASFNRPNIHYSVLMKTNADRQLEQFLESMASQAGIVYCGTRDAVDKVALKLRNKGFSARGYHAGLSYEERREVQGLFRHDRIDIVVATLAFGMGIDKPNVRFVVHYDLPKTIEHYYQETGRAGRDGLPSRALLLYNPGDAARLRSWTMAIEDENKQWLENSKLNHMIAFAEATHCRRQILLRYFDEASTTTCNYCDICDNPPEMQDKTEDAQKFLSCIYRLKQNYGMAYVIDVLRKSNSEKIKKARHQELSVYGIGQDKSPAYWKHLAWQLIHRDYCFQDNAHFNVLRLTKKAVPLLKNSEVLMLAMPKTEMLPEKAKGSRSKERKAANASMLLSKNAPLFEALRVLRREIADKENKPPFMIFSDNSLHDMANKKPKTLQEFLQITGVGQYKLALYGKQFLRVLGEFA